MRSTIATRSLQSCKSWLAQDYERNEFNVAWGSLVGLVAHPVYYLFCTYILTGFYDSSVLRFGAAILALPIIFGQKRIKDTQNQKAWLNLYWYAWLILTLPVTFTYILLANNFTPMWLICETMMVFITMILTGSFSRVLMILGIGIPVACVSYTLNTGEALPWSYDLWTYLAPLPMVLVSGLIFTASTKKSAALDAKNKAIAGLAGSIAHEMRNPLGQIKFSLDQIEHGLPIPSCKSGKVEMDVGELNALFSNVADAKQSIKRGLQVIEMTLHEVSGKAIDITKFEYVQASQLVQKAFEEYGFDSPGERSKVKINVTQDFICRVDETRFVFVIFNLLKNALYYFKLKPQATLTITIDKSKIVVRDTGPGIEPAFLGKLFGNFATSGKDGGTGLGLSFCKRMMNAFDGDISCTSVVGEFTEFVLRFPVLDNAVVQEYESKVLVSAHQAFNGSRILVVDDLFIMRQATGKLLAGLGCSIDEAVDGIDAIEKLRKASYDLVIMDLDMPRLDGYATAEQIRAGAAPWNRQVPIVAYTGECMYMAQVKTEKVGMDGFLSKPCNRLEFVRTLQNVLERAASKAKTEEITASLNGLTLLVADDDPTNKKIVRQFLADVGISTVNASHGREAIEILESGIHIDAVLMDMHMPGMSGVEAAQEIRKNKIFDSTPILALTANFSDESQEETAQAGMNGFISKPFVVGDLCAKLAMAIMELRSKPDDSPSRKNVTPIRSIDREWSAAQEMARDALSHLGTPLLETPRLDELIRLAGHDFVVDIVESFFQQMQEAFDVLPQRIESKNIDSVQQAVHKLMGGAGQVGASTLYQFIRQEVYYSLTYRRQLPNKKDWLETAHHLFVQTKEAMYGSYLAGVPQSKQRMEALPT